MKTQFTLFSGIFSVMALSNAIVPVLPSYAGSSALQGAIYASYFLGAFASTLPAGLLADRFGRMPLIRAGLSLTVASGFLLFVLSSPAPVIAARFAEGVGSGCFVAAAMSYVNSRQDHEHQSGYFLACLNAGLVTGLLLGGLLGSGNPAAGILLFSCTTLAAACLAMLIREQECRPSHPDPASFLPVLRDCRFLWISAIVLIGITGVASSLYPEYSGAPAEILGFWIAGMSITTIVAVLVASRIAFPPLPAIRISAVLMAAGLMGIFYSPAGFVLLGALAGIVNVAQMAVLAGIRENQGLIMGLLSTTNYLGMALLPFIAGLCADTLGFFAAFCLTAAAAVLVALPIGGDACR